MIAAHRVLIMESLPLALTLRLLARGHVEEQREKREKPKNVWAKVIFDLRKLIKRKSAARTKTKLLTTGSFRTRGELGGVKKVSSNLRLKVA